MEEMDIILHARGLLQDEGYYFFDVGNIDKSLSVGGDYVLPIFYSPGKGKIKLDTGQYVRINKIDISNYTLPTKKAIDSIIDQYINEYFSVANRWITEDVIIRPYDAHLELGEAISDIMELNKISRKIRVVPFLPIVSKVLMSTKMLMNGIEEIAISQGDRIYISQYISRDKSLLIDLLIGYYQYHFDGLVSIIREEELKEVVDLYKTLVFQTYSHYYSGLANRKKIESTIIEGALTPEKLSKEKIDFINPFLNKETVLVPVDLNFDDVDAETIIKGIKSYSIYKALVKKINAADTSKHRDIV